MPLVTNSKPSHIAVVIAQVCILTLCIVSFTLVVRPSNPAQSPTVKPVLAMYEQQSDQKSQPLVRADAIDDASTETNPNSAAARDAGSALDDTYAHQQWSFHNDPGIEGASGLFGSQEYLTSPTEVVVAVVDSGVMLEHEDLQFLPGYDFIHEPTVGNDGDGRDHDPSDPGDWVNDTDISQQTVSDGCPVTLSKWHGTAISGVISATTNNATGIAGGSPSVALLPVRVTGKCGGYVSDLIDGIRWAAGLEVDGVALNQHPASVINLSIGFPGSCSNAMQGAIDDAVNAGAILVTAATNSAVNLDTEPYSPASCENIITVAATDRSGALTSYSALGQSVFMSAPGGTVLDGIITTQNDGDDFPIPKSTYGYHYGTSIAAAHVSSAVANLLSYNPDLTQPQIEQLLSVSAKPTDFDPRCRSGECGQGRLDAYAAMELLAADYLLESELPEPQVAAAVQLAAVNRSAVATDSVVTTTTNDEDIRIGAVDWHNFLMIAILLSVRLRFARKT